MPGCAAQAALGHSCFRLVSVRLRLGFGVALAREPVFSLFPNLDTLLVSIPLLLFSVPFSAFRFQLRFSLRLESSLCPCSLWCALRQMIALSSQVQMIASLESIRDGLAADLNGVLSAYVLSNFSSTIDLQSPTKMLNDSAGAWSQLDMKAVIANVSARNVSKLAAHAFITGKVVDSYYRDGGFINGAAATVTICDSVVPLSFALLAPKILSMAAVAVAMQNHLDSDSDQRSPPLLLKAWKLYASLVELVNAKPASFDLILGDEYPIVYNGIAVRFLETATFFSSTLTATAKAELEANVNIAITIVDDLNIKAVVD